jgi:hypothetical protein
VQHTDSKLFQAGVVVRITALWAFSEAFLGGILHGFNVPFAGLALSLVAAVCMSLIAVNDEKKGAIMRATLVVLAIKFILSPHTPPMAYVAVLIEGLAGELFFLRRRLLRVSAFFLAVFCLMYSAFQHLLILTLIFGKGFWVSLDIFLNSITKTFIRQPQYYSLYIVVFYLGCYLVAGISGGILSSRLIARIQSGNKPLLIDELNKKYPEGLNAADTSIATPEKGRKVKWQYVIAGMLLLLLVLSYMPSFSKTMLHSKVVEIVIRGSLIIIVWNFLLSPLLIKWISKWVEQYKTKQGSALQEVLTLLPDIKQIVQLSWLMANKKNKLKQFSGFISNTMMLIVYGK